MSDAGSPSRKSGRRPVALQVRLAFGDLDEFVDRYATNLSEGGIFIRSRDPRPVGSRLSFELRLRGGELVFSGEGTVRWVQGLDSRGLGTPGMGLQFDSLTDESRAILQRILSLRGSDDAPPPVEGAVPSSWRPLEEFPPPPEPDPEPVDAEPAPPPVLRPGEVAATPRQAGFDLPAGLAQVIEASKATVAPAGPPPATSTAPAPANAPVPTEGALTADMLAKGLAGAREATAEDTAPPVVEVELPVEDVGQVAFAPAPVSFAPEPVERTAPLYSRPPPEVTDPGLGQALRGVGRSFAAPSAPPVMVPVGAPPASPPVMVPAGALPSTPPVMVPVAGAIGSGPPVMVPASLKGPGPAPGPVGIARIGLVQARPSVAVTAPSGIRSSRTGGSQALAIGVDVGWSSLRVGALTLAGGIAKAVPVGPGGVGVPALAAWDAGRLVVGSEAAAFANDGGWSVRGVMRLVGALPNARVVQAWKRRQVVDVTEGPDGRAALCLGREVVPAATIARALLEEVRAQAELATGAAVTQVAFALPAWFPLHQRRALKAVAEDAGLSVVRVVSAPVASFAGLHADQAKRRSLLVDWGDGGFTASVVEQSQNVVELAAVATDPELGLVDLDLALLGQALEQFEKDTGLSVPEDMRIFERVLRAVGEARVALHESLEHRLDVPDLVPAGLSKADLEMRLPRAKLAALAQPLVDRAYDLVRQALADRRFGGVDLDEVVLLGGVVKASALGRRLAEKLYKEPVRPEEARDLAAQGAARLADGERSVGRFVVGGVAGFSLGVLQNGQVRKVLDRQSMLPVERVHVQSTTEHKQQVMDLVLYQGEKASPADCERVGLIRVTDLPPAPRGELRVAVTLSMSERGELVVKAKDANSSRTLTAKLEEPPPERVA